jgi:diaminopimelate epimerase
VTIPFVKVEGLGNDFLVVDLRPGRPAAALTPSATDPEVVRALCDRNFGVGGDGVLAILPGERGDARMRVINADGSEAEMCGNGIRCVARVLFDTDPALRRPLLRIDTGAGLLECRIDAVDGRASSVTVQMGRPELDPAKVPVVAPAGRPLVRHTLVAGGREFAFTAVSMGNPHAVIFVDGDDGPGRGSGSVDGDDGPGRGSGSVDGDDGPAEGSVPSHDGSRLRALAASYGPSIERDPLFPRRTNVEFACVRQGAAGPEIDLVVWERGCGITLACGTGACATVVAACLEGRAQTDEEIPVNLPGGQLAIRVASDGKAPRPGYAGVSMRGPANIVFEAEIDPARIKRPAGR